MNPSRTECEEALANLPEPNVIATSILAVGYLKLPQAREELAKQFDWGKVALETKAAYEELLSLGDQSSFARGSRLRLNTSLDRKSYM
jgi:hypothetical protein